MGLFKKISNALKKTRENFARMFDYLFSKGELNDEFYEELTDILISCDVGYECSEEIAQRLREYARKNKLRTADQVREGLKVVVKDIFDELDQPTIEYPCIITMIGVNGVGKTTTIGKLANYFKHQKKEVTLVAGDTFRAAASEQLSTWADRSKTRIIKHNEGADAAAVVFDGIQSAKSKKTDVLLVDTAGRLHTKENLMKELEKIGKVIKKEYPEANKYNLIVIDATTGQNAINQLEAFSQVIDIDGVVLTKLDGTAKGGVVISIAKQLNIPVWFVGTGESIDDLELFDSKDFADNLF